MPSISPIASKLVTTIATSNRISYAIRNELVNAIVANGITPSVIEKCEKFGISLPTELAKDRNIIMYSLPASAVIDYCNEDEIFCIHFHIRATGAFSQLVIGPHSCFDINDKDKEIVQSHMRLSKSEASSFAEKLLKQSSFGIVLGIYAIANINIMLSGKVVAKCFGHNREIVLKEKEKESV